MNVLFLQDGVTPLTLAANNNDIMEILQKGEQHQFLYHLITPSLSLRFQNNYNYNINKDSNI